MVGRTVSESMSDELKTERHQRAARALTTECAASRSCLTAQGLPGPRSSSMSTTGTRVNAGPAAAQAQRADDRGSRLMWFWPLLIPQSPSVMRRAAPPD